MILMWLLKHNARTENARRVHTTAERAGWKAMDVEGDRNDGMEEEVSEVGRRSG